MGKQNVQAEKVYCRKFPKQYNFKSKREHWRRPRGLSWKRLQNWGRREHRVPADTQARQGKEWQWRLARCQLWLSNRPYPTLVPDFCPWISIVRYWRKAEETLVNPLTAEWALRTLIDFTLSNARWFYSSMGNPLDGKGLMFRVEVNELPPCFGSNITLFLFGNEIRSEICIVFYRFSEG